MSAGMQSIINISHLHQCIFIHIPKAAGTSIKQALDLPGGGHPPWQYYYTTYPLLWHKYSSFTVVRNPWDRLVSAYHYAKTRNSYWHNDKSGLHPDYRTLQDKTFSECVSILKNERGLLKHESWLNQTIWTTGANQFNEKTIMVDHVLRFENLAKEYARFCKLLNIKPGKLPDRNRTEREREYKHYYDQETMKMVADLYESDIDTFHYTF